MVSIHLVSEISETNQMIILGILLVMFFVIIYDILTKVRIFPKVTNIIISLVITVTALLSGAAIEVVHAIVSFGVIFGVAGLIIVAVGGFLAFILIHLGLGKVAFWLRRRR